MPVCCFF